MSFPCKKLCGHDLRRPHLSCLFCRVRRFYYGKMDRQKYRYNSLMRIVLPEDRTTYVLLIDNQRRFARVKAIVLQRLLTICEWLAN